jgi:GNAT superfamily N-acetyltransferase
MVTRLYGINQNQLKLTLLKKLSFIWNLIKKGEFGFLWQGISKRISSEKKAFGLKRDLKTTINPVRTFKKVDVVLATPEHHQHFWMDNFNNGIVERDIPSCYVALTEDNEPCFRQWLIAAKYNDAIIDFWGHSYPYLKEDESLIENAFTIPKYRGFGIMPYVMDKVAQKAREYGARYVICFTPAENKNSLRANHYAGFRPYILRTEKWFLFRKKIEFSEIPAELMEEYNTLTSRIK